MSTIDPPRGRDFGDLVRELIEEAWRRARRRRAMYGGIVLALAVVGAVVFARIQGPTSTNGSPLALGGSSAPVVRVATDPPRVYHGVFRLRGKRGKLSVAVAFPDVGRRKWNVITNGDFIIRAHIRFGQYVPLAGGHGNHVEAGGHASTWYARLVGLVVPKGGPWNGNVSTIARARGKQRVVIKLKGRPSGTFTLIPTESGVLKRDSGTQTSEWFG